MIARVWTARTTAGAPAYAEHLRARVIPDLKALDGYLGAKLWQRKSGDAVELAVVTYWTSLDAIRGFAGEEVERAVVSDEAAALLDDFDGMVRHYELVVEDRA